MRIVSFLAMLFFIVKAHGFTIPKNLSPADRAEVIQTLGINTSSKLTTKPYPLGGYEGLEVSLSVEFIDVSHIGRLGSQAPITEELVFPRINIGKGLHNGVDVFFSFSPFDDNKKLSEYGGQLRWSFYELKSLPINFSLNVHGNIINFNDSYINQNMGAELMAGLTFDDFGLYIGHGRINAKSTFTGGSGSESIVSETNNTNIIKDNLSSSHSFLGLSYAYSNFFLALQFDVYDESVYSAKLGLLF